MIGGRHDSFQQAYGHSGQPQPVCQERQIGDHQPLYYKTREPRQQSGLDQAKALHRYEQELAGVFNQQNLTAQQVLARTRELLPKYLVTFKYPGKKIRVVLPGGPHKGDVYQFSYLFYTGTYSKKKAYANQYTFWNKKFSIAQMRQLIQFIQLKFMERNSRKRGS